MSIGAQSNPPGAPAEPVAEPASAMPKPGVVPPERTATPAPTRGTVSRWRKAFLLAGFLVVLASGLYLLIPWVTTVLNTVSTDDAYVNSHVTFVAPRVK